MTRGHGIHGRNPKWERRSCFLKLHFENAPISLENKMWHMDSRCVLRLSFHFNRVSAHTRSYIQSARKPRARTSRSSSKSPVLCTLMIALPLSASRRIDRSISRSIVDRTTASLSEGRSVIAVDRFFERRLRRHRRRRCHVGLHVDRAGRGWAVSQFSDGRQTVPFPIYRDISRQPAENSTRSWCDWTGVEVSIYFKFAHDDSTFTLI